MSRHELLDALDARITERTLLGHPFYQSWSAGELTEEALAGYAREYFQLVRTVPELMETMKASAPAAMKDELEEHREEEAAHVEPWRGFARSLGVDPSELDAHEPLPETREAISKMKAAVAGTFEEGAAAMYALEREIPKIARTKMEGLEAFYGLTSDDALEYFRLHEEADVRHAATWRDVIETTTSPTETLMEAASLSLDAQHRLLDGCVRVYC